MVGPSRYEPKEIKGEDQLVQQMGSLSLQDKKSKKIRAVIEENPDVINVAKKTESIKFLPTSEPYIRENLEKLVENLTVLFEITPNASVEEIQHLQKNCADAIGKYVKRNPDFQCFVELAKTKAQIKPLDELSKRTFTLSLEPENLKELLKHFETLKQANKNIARILHGQDQLIYALLCGLNYDMEKLKSLIGPHYETVFRSITSLKFSITEDNDKVKINVLQHFPHVKNLTIQCNELSEKLVDTITHLKHLNTLCLKMVHFEKPIQLGDIFKMDTLKEFYFAPLHRTSSHFVEDYLKDLQGSNLEKLSLHYCDITCEHFPVLHHLRDLDLEWALVTDKALQKLQLPQLQKLSLVSCSKISDFTLPGLPKLQDLDLSYTNVTMKQLEILKTKNLKSLKVEGCKNIPVVG